MKVTEVKPIIPTFKDYHKEQKEKKKEQQKKKTVEQSKDKKDSHFIGWA